MRHTKAVYTAAIRSRRILHLHKPDTLFVILLNSELSALCQIFSCLQEARDAEQSAAEEREEAAEEVDKFEDGEAIGIP